MSWNNQIAMNAKMHALLKRMSLSWPVRAMPGGLLELELVYGCVVLKNEWEPNRHRVKITDFPDKTGFECFINHVHLPFAGTKESLMSCMAYSATLGKSLIPFAHDRQFRVIIAISEGEGCTVRFHQIRPKENWINNDLERYESEAILVIDVTGRAAD